ncbi:MAG: hypothetical protein KF873_11400 [Gemmataceae bacterium]|nr:hypothetical protein [Gemmataceae bacterium]
MRRGNIIRFGLCFALTFVPAVLVGCGETDKRENIIVKGNVTVDGKAMGGVTLSFFSPGEKVAVGTVNTQDDGSYEIMFKAHAGEGNYKVTAKKMQAKPGTKTFDKGDGIDDYQLGIASGASGGSIHLLPEKYSSVDRTDLTAVLQKGQNDSKNFTIKTK